MSLPPAGWFPNPDPGGEGMRYWDGVRWTEHYHQEARAEAANKTLAGTATSVGAMLGSFAKRKLAESRVPSSVPLGRAPTVAEVLDQTRLEAPRHPLDEQVEVVAEQYHTKGIKGVFADHSLPITLKGCTLNDLEIILVPMPWNEHDSNAVATVIGSHQVGFLPAPLAARYAYPLGLLAHRGLLATGIARLWAKDEGRGMVRARCTALIPEAKAFA